MKGLRPPRRVTPTQGPGLRQTRLRLFILSLGFVCPLTAVSQVVNTSRLTGGYSQRSLN